MSAYWGPKYKEHAARDTAQHNISCTQVFIEQFRKSLPQPLLSTPKLRVTRPKPRGDDELIPKRSARLAAKSQHRTGHPEKQARKVMMKRLGIETETMVPDEASFEEFQQTFVTREALDVLFPGRKQRAPVTVSAT